MISVNDAGRRAAFGELSEFRQEFYRSLRRRADALFELTDSVLCTDGPVTSLVGLSLAAEHRRGHGALYDAVNSGVVEVDRLRRALVGLPLPRDRDGRIVLTVDVSPWLRPDAATAEARSFCHVYGRGRNAAQMIPGWAYSFVAALETGRSSWTAVLDAVRIGPIEDATEVTAGQVREVVNRLREHGRWCDGDPRVLIVFDAGYDVTRLAWLLRDLPVDLVGRLRSDRVLYLPAAASAPGRVGRPARHGEVLDLDQPEDHPDPAVATVTETLRYGTAFADAWDRTHPRLTRRGGWAEHAGPLPIIEGTVIRLCVDRLPGDRNPKPVWLWACATGLSASEVHRIWQAHLRRFDVEHTFRLFKQTLGWTRPRLRDPRAADRWTWLIIAAHTQLRLARDLATDLRRPWERPPTKTGRLTPARVRRGFPNLHPKLAQPTSAPKPTRPGPGRPPGSRNKHVRPHPPVGKTQHQNATTNHNKPQKV
ncbi:NF041680 family putative transposase [Micromonospora sp. WMMA1363]|uniref:NF041680 family putative transposase n=1 Tax=Micromonospora sp. WMMA1363 TaxID=3053985 RepID=UPI0033902AC7